MGTGPHSVACLHAIVLWQGKGSFAYAWALDEGSEERARGVTMTIAVAHFETPKLRVVLLDAPGHKDFVPNMISGASQADAAILVVDASTGAFEAGLEGEGQGGGQTREHAQLVRSLGVEQLVVVVNKLDMVGYSKERFDFIKSTLQPFLKHCGFKDAAVQWVPVSAIDGQNLTSAPTEEAFRTWLESVSIFPLMQVCRLHETLYCSCRKKCRLPKPLHHIWQVCRSKPNGVSGHVGATCEADSKAFAACDCRGDEDTLTWPSCLGWQAWEWRHSDWLQGWVS